ncbi:hypothetical protein N657DRAFT_667752 [Parathielavia appendiculata]|uniref:Uncharacterized protein n=1 Tax=Parathielavia appendiculata TaxID=2587402 RepID=A0AAN6U9J4_9PEZI|nr:hypothetical protein N657DRAFT_667752 [Parathielavia appendiculata]
MESAVRVALISCSTSHLRRHPRIIRCSCSQCLIVHTVVHARHSQKAAMPASKGTLRRPILRFELASLSIDDRPNAYKNPQLVLKPQLELAPRRPYTGERPRAPVWRHYLMVHVKDKADELVKLDLDIFKSESSTADTDTAFRNSITCLFPTSSLNFRYSKGLDDGSIRSVQKASSLCITLQKPPDLDKVLQEFGGLGIKIEYKEFGRDHQLVSEPASFNAWPPLGRTVSPVYRPASNSRQLNSSSPPLTMASTSHAGYPAYLKSQSNRALPQRPPSQPIRPSTPLHPGQRPWSPAFVPSRPASTLGIPGILGEGIYKVSKIGSASSARPRVRRTSSVFEHQGPKLYTVSKHFDKTLSKEDIVHPLGPRYVSGGLPSSLQASISPGYMARSPSQSTGGTGSHSQPGFESPASHILSKASSALEGMRVNLQHRPGLRRLRTIDNPRDPSISFELDDRVHRTFLSTVAEERAGSMFSQPLPSLRPLRSADDASLVSSSPTLLERPTRQEMEAEWLLYVAQIQHEGLCEASRVWDEFWEKANDDVASARSAEDLSSVLSKLESDFMRRWEGVVAATAQKMRDVRVDPVF